MNAVTIHSDLSTRKLSLFPLFLHLFAMKWWYQMPWSYFFECWVLSQPFHSPLSLSPRGSWVFSNTTIQKSSNFQHSPFFMVQLSHLYMITGKTIHLTIWTFAGKVMSFLFLICCLFGHSFLYKEQAHFNFMAAITICSDFWAPKNKVWHFPHLFAMKWQDQMPWSSFSECWALSQLFHSPLSLSSRGSLVPLHFLP